MKLTTFIDKARIRGNESVNQIISGLSRLYDTARESFSYASSWGQLVLVVNNLYQIVLAYLADARSESNPLQAQRNNSIYGNAVLTGHNPARNRTAVGELTLEVIDTEPANGDKIYITNFTRIRCNNNGLVYSLDLGKDDVIINMNAGAKSILRAVEGIWEFQIFTGTGESIQSFEVNTPQGRQIDDIKYIVEVNGEQAVPFTDIYEIPFGTLGYVGRTGVFSGIDVLFGDKIAHRVPDLGASIRVDYLLTNGKAGNISDPNSTWEFVDTGFDVAGNEVDLNEVFRARLATPFTLGSNAEPPNQTKRVSVMYPRNNLIYDSKTIKYYFERLNSFNAVKVVRGDRIQNQDVYLNQYRVLLIPRLADRVTSNEDYFAINPSLFGVTRAEQIRLLNSLLESGRQSASISIDIVNITIRKYVLYARVELFEFTNGIATNRERFKQEIRAAMNEYLIRNSRINKIPLSDIVKLIDNNESVDTVKCYFLSQNPGPNNDNKYGIDDLGNINLPLNEYAILRGGWTDVDGVEYQDTFNLDNDNPNIVNFITSFVPNES